LTNPSKRSQKRFWILGLITLALFWSGGFYIGAQDLLSQFRKVQDYPVLILTENENLVPQKFLQEIEKRLPVRFTVQVATDPDSFIERAAASDLLWARKDWIQRTELHLTNFKSDPRVEGLLKRHLSADFFDPADTSSTLLPVLWTLPMIRVRPKTNAKDLATLTKLPGLIQWPFWGLSDFYSGFQFPEAATEKSEAAWMLLPSSQITPEIESKTEAWFPSSPVRPLLVCLSFVENAKIPIALKRRLVEILMDPRFIARTAAQTGLATTVVQAEELLPPWQRASSLRKIGLNRLQRP